MILITMINSLPIIIPNNWEASIIFRVSTIFYLLQMVNQDLFLDFVGVKYVNVFLLQHLFSKFRLSVESVVISQGIIFM